MSPPEYILRQVPPLPWHVVLLVRATKDCVEGYGCLVENPDTFEIDNIQ